MNRRLRWPLLGLLLVVGCAREASTPDGAFLLDEDVALVRGTNLDSAQRDFAVEVETHFAGAGIEVAALEVPNDSRLRLTLQGPPNANLPGPARRRTRCHRVYKQ